MVLPNTDRPGAIAVAERIREAILALEITHADAPVGRVSASFGVASVAAGAQAGLRSAELVERADRQLYAAKRSGRNKVGA